MRDTDNVFTIYDWKETSLYDSSMPVPETLKTRSAVEWHIGGRSNLAANKFAAWLMNQ